MTQLDLAIKQETRTYRHPNLLQVCETMGVNLTWALNKRKKALQEELAEWIVKKDEWLVFLTKNKHTMAGFYIKECNENIERINNQVKYLLKLAQMKREGATDEKIMEGYYDLDRAKSVPIRRVLENFGVRVERNYFRRRSEKTPSAYIYERDNRWSDFGDGKSGDVIDLYQELSNCNFRQALKELTFLV